MLIHASLWRVLAAAYSLIPIHALVHLVDHLQVLLHMLWAVLPIVNTRVVLTEELACIDGCQHALL